ncbi:L-threonylcarbamoyladenylate synthase [Salinarimonas rosea]|uniref:L-threonylcarbamoyladenylate synthase n=1 Tax=Salinarimonas rosea TaxID=552063 RepID=UPI0004048E6D|nr:L-threonylcarbamoyladenylate synthase [Salinarimonas rosea]
MPTRRLPADDPSAIADAAALLRTGALVAFPTETVYGLGADATDPAAVVRIYEAKQRPRFNPLIAHLPDAAAADAEGVLDARARRLADAFWPGPLTLVVPRAPGGSVCDVARAGLDTVALRVPAHPLAHALLVAAGRPIVAPSANRSGRVSPTAVDHVLDDLDGRIAAVLDGGETRVGVESTIVACVDETPRLLRPGGVPRSALEDVLGSPLAGSLPEGGVRAPGMLASHYAPRARVRLDAAEIRAGEAALLFGPAQPQGLGHAVATFNLSVGGDLAEAAARLFGGLRRLDASGAATIAVAPIPAHGLGEAIRDRLARAAAER